jgi:two-component system, OmpR family, response regulator RegX3
MSERPGPRVLIVEDEVGIRRGLSDVLRYSGCEVVAVGDGRSGLDLGLSQPWDLVVLDIMLPQLDGVSVCAELRASGRQMPVLMLTAKGEEDDVVRGLEAGADDYVIKPFSVRELSARFNALLRRSPRSSAGKLSIGPLELDVERSQVRCGEQCIQLTTRELQLLRVLALDAGRIVSRRRLLQEVWDMNNTELLETRTVDMHVAKLRKKLGQHGELIETVRGQGYRVCG